MRSDLEDAVIFARRRLANASAEYDSVWPRSLVLLRVRMVAQDELRNILNERKEFEDARDVQAVRSLVIRTAGGRR